MTARSGPGRLVVGAAVAMVAVVLLASLALRGRSNPGNGAALGRVPALLVESEPAPRSMAAYQGLGAWVDVYDYAPSYQTTAGTPPAVTPASVDEMAEAGVETLFIQAARNDERAPDGVVDPGTLAQFVVRAHRNGMKIVGWYLPKFADIELDLRRLSAISDFDVLGHRFDGLAVDIEFTGDVPDHLLRNQRLVELSHRLRERSPDDVLGAIVLPAVQLEVVNQGLWPGFPYRALADIYDVWLPMSYWTFRRADSGYQDGYHYAYESIQRLRANLGDPNASVHPIGGIGDEMTPEQLDGFLRSLADTSALGASVYDWQTTGVAAREQMGAGFAN